MMLYRALRAELLKVRRTLALVLIVLAPLSVDVLMWLVFMRVQGTIDNPWEQISHSLLFAWGVLMMPLFITLETALLGALDHNANGWKYLFALPVPRWTIYIANQIIVLVGIGISTVILVVGLWAAGMSIQILHLKPGLNFLAPFPWETLLPAAILGYVAAWLIITVHTFIAMRWSSFVLTIGVGMVAVMGAIFGANNQDWAFVYPWTLPAIAIREFTDKPSVVAAPTLLYSLVGAVIITVLGCWYFTRRNILN